MPFTLTYEAAGDPLRGELESTIIDTAYEAWHVAEKLGRDNNRIIEIKDHVGHVITLKDLLYRAAREAH